MLMLEYTSEYILNLVVGVGLLSKTQNLYLWDTDAFDHKVKNFYSSKDIFKEAQRQVTN